MYTISNLEAAFNAAFLSKYKQTEDVDGFLCYFNTASNLNHPH